eukprot:365888-Chlamydomonas_euryale.AAC.5
MGVGAHVRLACKGSMRRAHAWAGRCSCAGLCGTMRGGAQVRGWGMGVGAHARLACKGSMRRAHAWAGRCS